MIDLSSFCPTRGGYVVIPLWLGILKLGGLDALVHRRWSAVVRRNIRKPPIGYLTYPSCGMHRGLDD